MNMAMWKKKLLGGREHVFKDGKAVMDEDELANLPVAVRRLEVGDSIEFDEQAPLPPETPIHNDSSPELIPPKSEERISIISGEPANRRRFLNGQVYWLTDEEYGSYTLGKLAQVVREKSETVEELAR